MSQFLNQACISGYLGQAFGVLDEDRGYLYSPMYFWNYQMRGAQSVRDQYNWRCLWPAPALQGDFAAGSMLGQNNADVSGEWDLPGHGESGAIRLSFITGTVRDANNVAVAGAVVKCYLTSNDLEVNQTTSASDGTFQLGTPYGSSAHYLVGYYASAPDLSGASVNTLVPAL